MSHDPHEATLASPHGAGEFRLGLKTVVASFFGCAFAMGTLATVAIGPFVKPLGEEMGWSRPAVQAALLFAQGFSSFGVIVTGILLEKIGMRSAAIIGLIGTAVALVLVSLSTSLVYFYAMFALAAFVGAAAGAITWSRAITAEFDRHRGLALALMLSGNGLTLMFIPSFLVWMIGAHGWRAAYAGLALFPALIALPLALLLFRPKEAGDRRVPDGQQGNMAPAAPVRLGEIFGRYRFWVLLISIVCAYAAISAVLTNFIAALSDGGLSPAAAAAAQGAFGASLIVARLVVGFLVDRFWAPGVGALVTIPAVIGCLMLTMPPSFASATIAAALIGMALGAELDLLALLISRYFEPRYFARTYSYAYAGGVGAGAISPMSFALVQQMTGTYDAAFYIAAGLLLISGLILVTLGRYPDRPDAALASE